MPPQVSDLAGKPRMLLVASGRSIGCGWQIALQAFGAEESAWQETVRMCYRQ